jgi:hypothetical protein
MHPCQTSVPPHGGWFAQSPATQVLVIFIIRTRGKLLKSRAQPLLAATSLAVVELIPPRVRTGASVEAVVNSSPPGIPFRNNFLKPGGSRFRSGFVSAEVLEQKDVNVRQPQVVLTACAAK